MSVAFRRESDEEHLEPKFELPLPSGPNLVTPRGLALLEARVAELEAALPALSDETARKAAQRDLRYWRTRLATAEVVEAGSGDVVGFGCRVDLLVNGRPRTIELVGHDEADPGAGLLAFTAPLCRAVMGAEVGELVDFGGKVGAVEVVGVSVDSAKVNLSPLSIDLEQKTQFQ